MPGQKGGGIPTGLSPEEVAERREPPVNSIKLSLRILNPSERAALDDLIAGIAVTEVSRSLITALRRHDLLDENNQVYPRVREVVMKFEDWGPN